MNSKYLTSIFLSAFIASSSNAAVFGEGFSISVRSTPGTIIDLDVANKVQTVVANSDGEANVFWSVSKSYEKEHGYGPWELLSVSVAGVECENHNFAIPFPLTRSKATTDRNRRLTTEQALKLTVSVDKNGHCAVAMRAK